MSETTIKHVPTSEDVPQVESNASSPDELQESLDELARIADSLVDDLADEPSGPPATPVEDSKESRRAALQETLDRLEHLIEDPAPPPISAEIEVDGDRGEDISDRLDLLLASTPLDEAAPLDGESGFSRTEEASYVESPSEEPVEHSPAEDAGGLELPLDEAIEPSMATEELHLESHSIGIPAHAAEATAPAEAVATEMPKLETPPAQDGAPAVEKPAATPLSVPRAATHTDAAAIAPGIETRTVTESPPQARRRSTTIWRVLAVAALLGAIAGTIWFVFLRAPAESSLVGAEADVPMPDPPVVFTKTPKPKPMGTIRDEAPVRPEIGKTKPVPESKVPQNPGATTAYASATRDAAPTKPEPVVPEPIVEPRSSRETGATDSFARSTPRSERTAPEAAAALPAAAVLLAVEPVPLEPAAMEPVAASGESKPANQTQTRTASIGGALPLTVGAVAPTDPAESRRTSLPERASIDPARPEPSPAVAIPPDRPPVAFERVEPVIKQSSLRGGETQTVALRVLVTETGRVIRVVVDESVEGSEAEAAAINAVLLWTYEPAIENGKPVRRWTTERFEFERPSD